MIHREVMNNYQRNIHQQGINSKMLNLKLKKWCNRYCFMFLKKWCNKSLLVRKVALAFQKRYFGTTRKRLPVYPGKSENQPYESEDS